jgi:hypothetical protein
VSHDPLLDLIASLPPGALRRDHSERVRARCHATLAGLQRHRRLPAEAGTHESVRAPTPHAGRLWRLAALTGCAYALEVVRQVLLVYRVL